VGRVWQKVQYVTDPNGMESDQFGAKVSIDGSSHRFLIGVPFSTGIGKAVFGMIN
jgi:hypothetical protein